MKRLLFLLFHCTLLYQLQAEVIPSVLRCEYLDNPLGIDVDIPRLSWKAIPVHAPAAEYRQPYYQIIAASSRELLAAGKGDLWDSGVVRSDQSVQVEYKGKSLSAGEKCFWKVRIANKDGNWSGWSEPACWSAGLSAADWQAHWIAAPDAAGQNKGGEPVENTIPDPWLRKTFRLEQAPRQAWLYVASIGYHELYINGKKVGERVLAPSVTNHRKRARYITYDITGLLQPGENVIGFWLGVSWSIFPAYQTPDKPAAPMVLAQAELLFPDDESQQICTDATWKTHPSPNTLTGYWDAHHFGGEYYDATRENEQWCSTGYDDSAWASASLFYPGLILSAEKTEPDQLIREITPLSVTETGKDTFRIDMGVNYAGWFEIEFTGTPGEEVKFEFSEREEQLSSYGLHSIYKTGETGTGTFRNRFNYMSCRWVTVTGLREKHQLNQIRGWMIRPAYERTGSFACNLPLFNRIYETALWTFENLSLGSYVVDCPQRERRGYGGDALATTRMALGNYQLGAFYTKWNEDWKDVQEPDGNIPHTAPTYLGGGGPSWSGFCIELPWEIYRQYGDRRILEESFPVMEGWLSFLETQSKENMLVRWGGKWSFLGDWLWPEVWPERSLMEQQGKGLGDTRESLFYNNCNWIYTLDKAAAIAAILNHPKATLYRERAEEIRKAVHRTFYNEQDHSYVNGYPGYLAITLAAGVPPPAFRRKGLETAGRGDTDQPERTHLGRHYRRSLPVKYLNRTQPERPDIRHGRKRRFPGLGLYA